KQLDFLVREIESVPSKISAYLRSTSSQFPELSWNVTVAHLDKRIPETIPFGKIVDVKIQITQGIIYEWKKLSPQGLIAE
ncbi:MAG: hypothetical protein ABJQ14_13020, partial [Hyphomicrobiales bacterium]